MFDSTSVHPELPLGEDSILYPLSTTPPVLLGAIQESVMLLAPPAVAERFVGAPGTVAKSVTALATLDVPPVPTELIALTR